MSIVMASTKLRNLFSKCHFRLYSSSRQEKDEFKKKVALQEAKLIKNEEILNKKALEKRRKLEKSHVVVEGQPCIKAINHIPEEQLKTRKARIYQPPKNVMQSGTDNIRSWVIDFNRGVQWENPNMGWCSSNDPLSGMKMFFKYKEDAIAFCEKQGWQWWLQERFTKDRHIIRNYSDNFLYKSRKRVSTK